MSKEEIALELTKLSFSSALKKAEECGEIPDGKNVVTDLYNYIFTNIKCAERNK